MDALRIEDVSQLLGTLSHGSLWDLTTEVWSIRGVPEDAPKDVLIQLLLRDSDDSLAVMGRMPLRVLHLMLKGLQMPIKHELTETELVDQLLAGLRLRQIQRWRFELSKMKEILELLPSEDLELIAAAEGLKVADTSDDTSIKRLLALPNAPFLLEKLGFPVLEYILRKLRLPQRQSGRDESDLEHQLKNLKTVAQYYGAKSVLIGSDTPADGDVKVFKTPIPNNLSGLGSFLYVHPKKYNGLPECTRDIDPGRSSCLECDVKYVEVPLITKRCKRKRLSPSALKEIFEKTKDSTGISHCYLCWGEIRFQRRGRSDDQSWEVDHVVPVSKHPIFDTMTNMLPAHGTCNNAKGAAGAFTLVVKKGKQAPMTLIVQQASDGNLGLCDSAVQYLKDLKEYERAGKRQKV